MEMINCPACKIPLSSAAVACPKCGHPIRGNGNPGAINLRDPVHAVGIALSAIVILAITALTIYGVTLLVQDQIRIAKRDARLKNAVPAVKSVEF